jgi:drug/metabolite transporter (DMT)-like permease
MSWLNLAVSALGLIAAVVLLVVVLRLRRVASGGAVAEHLPFVVLGIVSFAGAALVWWVANFLGDRSSVAQAALGAQMLTVVGMSFFAWYFFRLQRALSGYLENAERVLSRLDSSSTGAERG